MTGGAAAWSRGLRPDRRTIGRDAIASLSRGIGAVPDGMAASVLAGVNPVYGLYASFAGPIAGGLFTSTTLMVVTTTSAAALAAGSVLEALPADARTAPLLLMTLLAGSLMVVAAVLRLGRFTRFVSHSVMIGFLSGVAVNIIAGQLADLTGAEPSGSVALTRAINIVLNPSSIDVPSFLVGLGAIALIVGVGRTRLSSFAAIVALVVPTVAVVLLGLESVATVDDVGDIPSGVPTMSLPSLADVSLSVLAGAAAIAAIVLVQGAGVAESAPNLDGSRSNANRDFLAQGVGNIAAALFRGQPVGGSVGMTALNVASGARSRWAVILSGFWVLLILVLFSGAVGRVAMPTLAAVLIVAGIGALRVSSAVTIWRTGASSQIALATTFLSTLFLPVYAAVGVGTAISLLLQLNRDAMDLRVVELRIRDDGRWEERPAPRSLPNDAVTVLDVYGSLYYAGARTLEVRLPNPAGSERAVVVLRLRGRTALGATGLGVLDGYANAIGARGGRLYLSGVEPSVDEALRRTGRVTDDGPLQVFPAQRVIGASTDAAIEAAEAWLASRRPESVQAP